MLKNFSKTQRNVLLISIFIFIITLLLGKNSDGDTLFHIKIGEWIIQNKMFPTVDMFSMHENLSYSAYAYGFDIILYLIYKALGFKGLVLFKYLFWYTIILMSSYFVYKLSKSNNVFYPLIVTGIIILGFTFKNIRPHMISYMILIIQLYIMNKWAKNKESKIIYLIPITFLILNNLHAGVFPYHFFVVGAFGIELLMTYDKKINFHNFLKDKIFYRCLLILLLSFGSMGINPYFPGIFKFSLGTLENKFTPYIAEWQTPPISAIMVLLLVAFVIIRFLDLNKTPLTNVFNAIVAFALAVNSSRFIPYMAITLLFLTPYCTFPKIELKIINKFYENKLNRMLTTLLIAIASVFILFLNIKTTPAIINWEFNESEYPVKIVEYMKENNINTNIYNNYNDGAFLLFNDIKVFIDPRCDLYSSEFNDTEVIDDYLAVANGKPLSTIMDKYNLEYALINSIDKRLLDDLENYEVLIEDEHYSLIKYK